MPGIWISIKIATGVVWTQNASASWPVPGDDHAQPLEFQIVADSDHGVFVVLDQQDDGSSARRIKFDHRLDCLMVGIADHLGFVTHWLSATVTAARPAGADCCYLLAR
jgi:hypothetical protein